MAQYLRDTRAELNHVAWPTRKQTLVFTALVIAISIGVSLYLGVFDYLFTNAVGWGLELLPGQEGSLEINMPTSTDTPAGIPASESSTADSQ